MFFLVLNLYSYYNSILFYYALVCKHKNGCRKYYQYDVRTHIDTKFLKESEPN